MLDNLEGCHRDAQSCVGFIYVYVGSCLVSCKICKYTICYLVCVVRCNEA